ncbi:MAG: tetratricopeptide repeat protein [Myxococcales bacterium]|nr:tetratricopeptide repeat protein [Myxococcales bacterium]
MRQTLILKLCLLWGVVILAKPAWAEKDRSQLKPAPRTQKPDARAEQPPAKPAKKEEPESSNAADGTTLLRGKLRDQEMKEMQQAYKDFRRAAKDYLGEVRELVRKQYRERRKLLVDGYKKRLDKLDKDEELARRKAIQYFIAFIRRYPNHPRYTPDAMYRLAELYYEEEFNEYLARAKKYEEDLQKFENKEIPYEPLPAKKRFLETTRWLNELVQRFPSYRFVAGAYYLLGYCIEEEGKGDEAIQYFRKITENYPKSRFIAEAWIRIGEFHFRKTDSGNVAENRAKAKEAYSKVLAYPKHPMFDKALYKLAWTHYLLNEFDSSVKRFTQLLEFYRQKEKDGQKGGGDLRREAIQYIAISFADEEWGSPEKAEKYVRQVGLDKPYAREILLNIAENYATQNNWDMAIAMNRKTLDLFPYHPTNPLVQERIVQAYMRKQDFSTAMLERSNLIKRFGVNTPWEIKNRSNVKAQRSVQKIISDSIYQAALFRHESCNVKRSRAAKSTDPAEQKTLLLQSQQDCVAASDNYREFLRRFPHHKEVYTLTWYLADSLFYALRFKDASVQFRKVRDWPGGGKFTMEASFGLVDSLVQLVNAECRQGTIQRACELPEEANKKAEDPKAKKKKQQSARNMRCRQLPKLPIHPLQKQLAEARDAFLALNKNPKDPRNAEQSYSVARIYFSYDHLAEARKRLMSFLQTYPQHKLAKSAGDTIIASHRRQGCLDEMVAAIDELKKFGLKFPYEKELKVGVIFIKAKRFKEKGKWVEAAKAYLEAVRQNPKDKDAPAGLWNAALMYEKAKMFGSALKVYDMVVRRYPTWRLRDGKGQVVLDKEGNPLAGADQALFFVAYNAEKYFNFEKAIEKYMDLVNNRAYRDSHKRADALYNAAVLMESLQRYDDAARAYQRYARDFSSRKDAPDVFYNAVKVYQRTKRTDDVVRLCQAFIRRYQSNNEYVRRVMQCHGTIFEEIERKGLPWSRMKREYEKIIRTFDSLRDRMKPVDRALTSKYAAKAAYMLAMKEYEKFDKFRIDSTNPKKQKRQISDKSKRYTEMVKEFNRVALYSSAPWLLCALYRISEGKQKIAQGVSKAPLPKIRGLRWTDEAKEIYKEKIDQGLVRPLEDQAQILFRKVVDKSKELFFENDCTNKAYEAIHRADPKFPLPKKLEPQTTFEPLSPLPLISLEKEKVKVPATKAPAKR